MNFKRIGRTLICLLLVCVLLVNVSPIRAEASAGAAIGTITGVASVSVPAALGIGAIAITLGVMAGSNDDFVNMVDYAVDTATDWVKDGTVELLRVVDATGKAAYYAAGDFLESLRMRLFEDEFVFPSASTNISYSYSSWSNETVQCSQPVKVVAFLQPASGNHGYPNPHAIQMYLIGTRAFIAYFSSGSRQASYDQRGFYYISLGSSTAVNPEKLLGFSKIIYGTFADYVGGFGGDYTSSYDLNIGHVSSVPIDGSSALDWSEEYASKRIYVTGGSDDPDPPDENNGKWFWPIALPLTAATLLAMSQADEWAGETPQEFDQYTQNTEFEILDRPEFDGYQAIEIAPVTNPNPNPNPDDGENPDIGDDSDTDSEAEKTWFQRIVKGIEELPSKFGQWLDKILEWLQKIWEAIISTPQAILDGLKNVLSWAFAPSEAFIQSKVEALIAKYPTAATFTELGHSFRGFFDGLGEQPPIIYIDLGASEGDYVYGGRMAFIDLTWYARYKPTVDTILGAFIWLWVAWRFFVSIPGIISGAPGIFGSPNEKPDTEIHVPRFEVGKNWLNSGSSYHKKGDGGGV